MNGGVVRIQGLLSLALSSKGGEGNTAAATEHRDACKEQAKGQSIATAAPQLQVFAVSAPVCS